MEIFFGGYAPDSWGGSGYINNSKAFLFSLVNVQNIPQMFNSLGKGNEIYRNATYGPTFGSGHDIYISNNSNSNTSSYTNFPYSYQTVQNSTGLTNTFFAGSYNFKTKEIEIFGYLP